MTDETLAMALPKGRMLDPSLEVLGRAGVRLDPAELESRRLEIHHEESGLRFLLVKPVDVPTYVEYGIADVGISGRDVLLETEHALYQPLDLGFGRCRLSVAGPPDAPADEGDLLRPLRVATTYPNVTYRHFNGKGVPVEVVPLSGSVELACLSGLADLIVDLVETGRTLRENGLVEREEIAVSTARLVVNRASHKLKLEAVRTWLDRLAAAREEDPES